MLRGGFGSDYKYSALGQGSMKTALHFSVFGVQIFSRQVFRQPRPAPGAAIALISLKFVEQCVAYGYSI